MDKSMQKGSRWKVCDNSGIPTCRCIGFQKYGTIMTVVTPLGQIVQAIPVRHKQLVRTSIGTRYGFNDHAAVLVTPSSFKKGNQSMKMKGTRMTGAIPMVKDILNRTPLPKKGMISSKLVHPRYPKKPLLS